LIILVMFGEEYKFLYSRREDKMFWTEW
jgi:hypothetical protein